MNRPNMWTFTSVYNVLIYNKSTDIRKYLFWPKCATNSTTCDCKVIAHTFEQIVFTVKHIGEGLQVTGI